MLGETISDRLRACLGGRQADKRANLLFTTGRGHPLGGNNVRTRSFARLLGRACLPPMRFHGLPHTAATLLMAEGVDIKIASEMLDHADITTTLRIYSHVLPHQQDTAADAMDRLLAR